jgi:hypothetical protein
MAEMTTLLAAIYRKFTTSGYEKQSGVSPGITSRFEVFYDESFPIFEVRSYCHPKTDIECLQLLFAGTRMLDQFQEPREDYSRLMYFLQKVTIHIVPMYLCLAPDSSLLHISYRPSCGGVTPYQSRPNLSSGSGSGI